MLTLAFSAMSFLGCDSEPSETRAVIETDLGKMTVVLYDQTPKHKENFVKLAEEGYYDSLMFHRVIPGFMIQGGDPISRHAGKKAALGTGGPGYMIDAEIGAPHIRGALAAARKGGPSNPEKRSSGSQFYIVTGSEVTNEMLDMIEERKNIKYNEKQREMYLEKGGTPNLDGDYTVFGEVVEGMEVAEKIAAVERNQRDRPKEDIRMEVSIQEPK